MPSVIIFPSKDTCIDSNAPTSNFGNLDVLFLGRYMSMATYRTLIQFDISLIPIGTQIISAYLKLYLRRNDYPAVSKTYNAYRILTAWGELTATWNNQPAYDPSIEATLNVGSGTGYFVIFDVTNLVNNWYQGLAPNNGILIKEVDETINALIGFSSRNDTDPAFYPRLEITYQIAADVVDVNLIKRKFQESLASANTTSNDWQFTTETDVSSLSTYGFFAKNIGETNTAVAKLQISPDASNWLDNTPEKDIASGQSIALVPNIFSKYVRIAYKNKVNNANTKIDVWLQGQV